jgi:4-hydroxy-tetrahydrodipicolinate synthase
VSDEILTARNGRILVITINRPESRNAVNLAVSQGLADAVDELDENPDLSVAVLTGAGGNFCAGMDLKALEVAIEEGRAANPDVVVQACTAATSAKDCLELTQHAQEAGADFVYIQTPMMETHGGEGVLRFFRYISGRTDIALGMFNSPSSGYVLTPAESARIYTDIRAVCATKEGAFRPASSRMLHELAPELVIWECDTTGYRAGWLRAGFIGPAQLGTAGYLYEIPQQPILSEYWDLVWNDKLIEAMDYAEKSGMDQFGVDMRSWFTCYPGRPDYFTHWGGAFKYAASLLGLPIGDYPHSRPRKRSCPTTDEHRYARPISASD